jgi:histone acetyltransferase (RNA polymerase elongator complex component)
LLRKKLIIPIKSKTDKIVPVFLPNFGCKHRCIFCNEYIATDADKLLNLEESIEFYNANNSEFQLAFYGASFTAMPLSVQEKFLVNANLYTDNIRISTIPDEIDQKKLDFLKSYNVKAIEIGVQSFYDDVLTYAKRSHNSEQAISAAKLIRANNIELGIHLMVGLPLDSKEKDIKSATIVSELQASTCRIAPTIVFKDTELEKLYLQGSYTPITLKDSVDIISDMAYILLNNGIKINRFGLHISEAMRKGGVVAGPIHESFGDLIYSEMIFKQIDNNFDYIEANLKYKNLLVGYKGVNRNRITLPITYSNEISGIDLVKL